MEWDFSSRKVMSGLEEQLYAAVNKRDVELTKCLLTQGANVNSLVNNGRTVVGRAAQLGDTRNLQVLLEAEKYLPPENFPVGGDDSSSGPSVDMPASSSVSLVATMKNANQPGFQDSSYMESENYRWKDQKLDIKGSIWQESDDKLGLGLFHALRKTTFHKRRCDVNLPDFYDRMPIHYAADSGEVEAIKLLLNAGSRVNVSDSDNITPLHLAISHGYSETVEVLLKAGSLVNSKTSDKSSALHIAASRGFCKIINMLLQCGAKIDILDASDRTPLFLAVTRHNHDVVRLLLNKGAKINVEEIHGYTPLSEAIWHNNKELVRLLLESGAKITGHHYLLHYCVLHRFFSLCQLLIQYGAFLNVRDRSGDTPLHIAVRTAETDTIELLLEHGSNVNLGNGISGQTVIHEAVNCLSELELGKFVSVLEILLRYGGKLNSESFTPGDTPLYRAILLDKFLFAEELIRNGSNANLGNVYSCSIDNLFLARRKNHFRTVQLLVYSGFDLKFTPWLEILPSNISYSCNLNSIKGWLIYMKTNPMKLSDLCRLIIRRSLQENIIPKVNILHTPMPIKNFLLFRNIEFLKEENAENANVYHR